MKTLYSATGYVSWPAWNEQVKISVAVDGELAEASAALHTAFIIQATRAATKCISEHPGGNMDRLKGKPTVHINEVKHRGLVFVPECP